MDSEIIILKKITDQQITELKEFSERTFLETFAKDNSEEDMKRYLEINITEEKLSGEMNNPDSEFYFAMSENRIIGYLKLNFAGAQTEIRHADWVEIERIYVLREFHGKKAGQILLNKAVELARDRYADHIWLGVWEKNARAIRFYQKNGFISFDTHIFKLGDDEQTDLMMKRKL